jgi:hypothetical protein
MSASDGDTKAFESAQALFCAMADFLGNEKAKDILNYEKYKTYGSFKSGNDVEKEKIYNEKLINDSYKKLKTTGVSLELIEKILIKDVDWYKSSVNIAVKLIEDITKIDSDFKRIQTPGWADFFYYRGAKGGSDVMEDIEKLFTIANKQEKLFGDINKWSPADIYFSSSFAEKKIQGTVDTMPLGFNFINLNQLINGLIDAGELLGVSLKKAPDSVEIKRINFTTKLNQEILENIKYLDTSDNKKGDRDITIYFGNSKAKPFIKIRHDPYSEALGINLAVKCEIEGKNSRLGSLTSFGTAKPTGTGITDLWARVDPKYANTLATSFKLGSVNYKNAIPDLNKKYANLAKTQKTGIQLKEELKKVLANEALIKNIIKLNGGFDFEKKIGMTNLDSIMKLGPTLYQAYQNERIYLSVTHIVSSFEKLILDYFNEGKRVQDVTEKNATKSDIALQIKKNNVILEFYKYASGMSPSSGKFVIAK